MKYLRCFMFLFLMINLVGCKDAEDREMERIDKLCDEVTFDTVRQLIKTHEGLQFIGMGGGGVNGINLLTVSFISNKKIGIDEGRKLIVECSEKFLKNINESEKLRPVLKDYPFYPKNIEVSISFLLNNKKFPLPPNLCFIVCRNGTFEYSIDNKEDSELVLEESYEKALEIVKNQSKIQDKEE